MHVFPEDFYGAELRVCVAGYIRDERKFPSLGGCGCVCVCVCVWCTHRTLGLSPPRMPDRRDTERYCNSEREAKATSNGCPSTAASQLEC